MVLLENGAVSCTNDVVPIPPLTSNFGDHQTYFTHSYILAGKENCFHFFLLSSPVPDRSDETLPTDQRLRLSLSDHEEMSVSGAKNIST